MLGTAPSPEDSTVNLKKRGLLSMRRSKVQIKTTLKHKAEKNQLNQDKCSPKDRCENDCQGCHWLQGQARAL